MTFAVIDTNILVSALLTRNDTAATLQVFQRVIPGDITPVYSVPIMDEYKEVLSRSKFHFPQVFVDNLLSGIEEIGVCVEGISSGIVLPDMDDLPFYEAARAYQTHQAYLVTGNIKHFPQEPFIVTARQLIDLLPTWS